MSLFKCAKRIQLAFTAKSEMHDLIRRAMELRKKKNVKEGYELLVDHIVKVNGLFLSLVAFPTVELLMRMEIF